MILRGQLWTLRKSERRANWERQGKPGKRGLEGDFAKYKNCFDLRLSFRTARDYWQITNHRSFKAGIDELHKHGLIDILHQGGGFEGDAGRYAISERWMRYDEPNFLWPRLNPDPATGDRLAGDLRGSIPDRRRSDQPRETGGGR